jgi:SAM-dependent methyltransferase
MSIASKFSKARSIVDPTYRLARKRNDELQHWIRELEHLDQWFNRRSTDWWGIKPPTKPLNPTDNWKVNAVMTMHAMRPSYHEELQIEGNHFAGRRVLEIGCGPLVPILQFSDCERHGVDQLNGSYIDIGWPLYGYDAKLISCPAEKLPYPDGYFDAVISVNALDHVDDFGAVCSEMQRVLKKGGEVRFAVEYHKPTIAEPLELDDGQILAAFNKCDLKCIVNRSQAEMFEAMATRYDLIKSQLNRFGEDRVVTWAGVKA